MPATRLEFHRAAAFSSLRAPVFRSFRPTLVELPEATAGTRAGTGALFLDPGDEVRAQWWVRDSAHPDGTGVQLSNGTRLTIAK